MDAPPPAVDDPVAVVDAPPAVDEAGTAAVELELAAGTALPLPEGAAEAVLPCADAVADVDEVEDEVAEGP